MKREADDFNDFKRSDVSLISGYSPPLQWCKRSKDVLEEVEGIARMRAAPCVEDDVIMHKPVSTIGVHILFVLPNALTHLNHIF